jgi:hypothetical protein
MTWRLKHWRVDMCGAIVVLTGIVVGSWFGCFRPNSARAELVRLRDLEVDMQREYSLLQRKQSALVQKIAILREGAEEEGLLAEDHTIEVRLRALRALATTHGFTHMQILPVQWRSDAAVSAQTFSVMAQASYANLLSFMATFERSRGWADVSHLQIAPREKELVEFELSLTMFSEFGDDAARLEVQP